jgi:hypothetical protein
MADPADRDHALGRTRLSVMRSCSGLLESVMRYFIEGMLDSSVPAGLVAGADNEQDRT